MAKVFSGSPVSLYTNFWGFTKSEIPYCQVQLCCLIVVTGKNFCLFSWWKFPNILFTVSILFTFFTLSQQYAGGSCCLLSAVVLFTFDSTEFECHTTYRVGSIGRAIGENGGGALYLRPELLYFEFCSSKWNSEPENFSNSKNYSKWISDSENFQKSHFGHLQHYDAYPLGANICLGHTFYSI